MPYIPLQPSAYSHSEISNGGSNGEEEQARPWGSLLLLQC